MTLHVVNRDVALSVLHISESRYFERASDWLALARSGHQVIVYSGGKVTMVIGVGPVEFFFDNDEV